MSISLTVDGVGFTFDFVDFRIDVDGSVSSLDVYVLWKAIREAQGSGVGISYPVIARASGLDTLDASTGNQTYITVTLFGLWEVNSLKGSGKFTLSYGNLIKENGDDPFRDNPLITYFAFFSQAGTITTVNSGSGLSTLQAQQLQELWRIKGLDDSTPVSITDSSIVFSGAEVDIADDGTTTTLARQ